MLRYCREPSSAYYSYILYYSTCRLTQNVINIQRNKYNFFRLLIHLLRQQCVSSFINTFEPKSTINYFSSILTNIFKENKYLFWQHVLIPVHTLHKRTCLAYCSILLLIDLPVLLLIDLNVLLLIDLPVLYFYSLIYCTCTLTCTLTH